jgi:hypothetical protein
VHKVAKLHKTAVARDGTRVITFERLAKLRDAVRVFTTSLMQGRNFADPDSVEERLAAMWLTGKMFASSGERHPANRREFIQPLLQWHGVCRS